MAEECTGASTETLCSYRAAETPCSGEAECGRVQISLSVSELSKKHVDNSGCVGVCSVGRIRSPLTVSGGGLCREGGG